MRILKYRKRDRAQAVNRQRHDVNAQRVKMRVTKGDTVRIMVEGVNIVTKHKKARRAEEQSEKMQMPAPIHASNVMLVDPKSGNATRIKMRIDEDGTKE